MSRIGKLPISVPSGVNISVSGDEIKVKGPKGELTQKVDSKIEVAQEDGELVFKRADEQKETKAKRELSVTSFKASRRAHRKGHTRIASAP